MTNDQIVQLRQNERIAAIVTTRNAAFWLVDSNGEAGTPGAHYTVESWDDTLGILYLTASQRMRSDQFRTRMAINYEIIDEMILLAD